VRVLIKLCIERDWVKLDIKKQLHPSNELLAIDWVINECSRRLEEYPTQLEEDGQLLQHAAQAKEDLPPWHLDALTVQIGEKEILEYHISQLRARKEARQLERLAESKLPQEKKIREERIPVAMQSRQVDSPDPYGHARCLAVVRKEFAPEAVLQADYTCPGIVKFLVMASYPVHCDGEPMDTPMDTLAGTVDVPANISMFI
ncbi:hypothetical protein CYMTET_52327, partial [Cymbomonas tetramitiformis]